jgi:hypothetical protein
MRVPWPARVHTGPAAGRGRYIPASPSGHAYANERHLTVTTAKTDLFQSAALIARCVAIAMHE